MNLDGKHAVVTGGQGWLGHAMTAALVELGASVTVISRGKSDIFGEDAHDDGHISVIAADVTDREDIENFVTYLGYVDILVNNMCAWPKQHDFLKTTWDDIEESFSNNLIGQLYLTKEIAAQHMPNGGSIINVTSMYGKVSPDPKMYRGTGGNALEYGASKAALLQSTKWLAAHLGHRNIRCNSISPGPFSRPGSLNGKEWFEEELNNRTMLGRVACPEELKGAVALLATDLGSYITGEDIAVDGGWTAF